MVGDVASQGESIIQTRVPVSEGLQDFSGKWYQKADKIFANNID